MPLLGAKKSTLVSAAGIGDFIATATSPLSTNYRAGAEIGKKGSTAIASEGLITLPSLLELVGAKRTKLPLLSALQKVVIECHDARTTFNRLIGG